MRLKKSPILIAAASVIAVILLIFGSFAAVRVYGKSHLQKNTDISDSPIHYQDKLYTYNHDILTFLVMGIDQDVNGTEEVDNVGNGQADALFLAVFNTKTRVLKVIGINRNTMVNIYDCDDPEGFVPVFPAQIALQHAYGPDSRVGCEYQQKVVQDLFYGLPIHGYVAVKEEAIPALNDLVGGVEVDVKEDMTFYDPTFVLGTHIHLMGEHAYRYIKYRDCDQFGSADARANRQAEYLDGFIAAAKRTAREDPFRLLQMYDELKPQVDTDISMAEVLYLASILPQYRWDKTGFYHLPGETVMGEIYEEFYPDEEALLAMVLDIFYEEMGETP